MRTVNIAISILTIFFIHVNPNILHFTFVQDGAPASSRGVLRSGASGTQDSSRGGKIVIMFPISPFIQINGY